MTTIRKVVLARWCAAIVSIVSLANAAPAGAQSDRENQMKAAFLLNFAKLVTWPDEIPAPDRFVCLLGTSPLSAALQTIDGRTAQGKTIRTRTVGSVNEAAGCHIVFVAVPDAEIDATLEALHAAGDPLTVGDTNNFASRGGVIGLASHRNRVRLELNVGAADRRGLVVSSQLLRMSNVVETSGG